MAVKNPCTLVFKPMYVELLDCGAVPGPGNLTMDQSEFDNPPQGSDAANYCVFQWYFESKQ